MSVSVRVYLRVHQHIIEQYEPVIGETASVLWDQRSVAAFTYDTALRETKNLLENTGVNFLISWMYLGPQKQVWISG